MQSAPSVDRGDTSTMAEPMLMEMAKARASVPGRRAAMPGTIGRKAGSTTDEVLE